MHIASKHTNFGANVDNLIQIDRKQKQNEIK